MTPIALHCNSRLICQFPILENTEATLSSLSVFSVTKERREGGKRWKGKGERKEKERTEGERKRKKGVKGIIKFTHTPTKKGSKH